MVWFMDDQTLFILIGAVPLALIVLFCIGLYLWYFKFGGKKLLESP